VSGNEISMTACLSVAVSSGRSPLIILREAERSLSLAKQHGHNSVRVAGEITPTVTASPELRRFTAHSD
jgi:hypothetical protein